MQSRTPGALAQADAPHNPHALRPSRTVGLDAQARARALKFVSYYRPHIPLLLADLACAVLVSATALFLPLCANYVARQLGAAGATPQILNQVYAVGGVMLGLLAVQVLATLFVDYQGHVMGAKMESALRKELFEHCQTLPFRFYDRTRTGQLMSRITNDLFMLGELYHHGPEDLAIAVLKFAGAIAILAYLDVPLTLMIVAIIPLAVIYALHFSGRMNIALTQSKRQVGAINERVEDSLAGIRVVKSFANEDVENRRFETENLKFLDTRRAGYRSEAFFSVGTTTFAQLITVVVIVAGAIRVQQAQLSVADMLTFLLCVAVLIDPVQRLANFVRLWQQGYTGFTRMMEILETAPEVADRPGAIVLDRPRGTLAFRDVSFRYDEDGPHVLRNVSLDIRPGEFVALVGSSGVGKTTLCSLIPRFYEPSSGAVMIDGTDVRDLTLSSLRRNVAVVQQDVYLFAGSVAENLRYGRPDASEAEIVEAARRANAHDFIMALPNGYDTDIGQRGVKLSGGQKQRLTIARAFLKDAPILIFDEATSALDNESEKAVQGALGELARNRTTLVIAHRLSTVRNADRILVLTDQGVAEQGSHEQLIAAGGAYERLYRMQASI
ncbi:ABC transporter ATP-binding protein [Phenylobacterium sp. 58.2.17]|uniref:ABC transporter ATP-binding protein n=1 Tax=Phenylobacterium sp. 58.2.17 TaxID=2969306 RepID=UPI002264C49C|nr:ABC transporter ATP-binding protein [Phenylobacterium sp. 58.2.17]MCX7586699.1 ABC transporter ATP-binding protein [Phenylobacterium sp. 58.2.17]